MLAQSGGVSDVHPQLQATCWQSIVSLSEKSNEQKHESDFENFIPKFMEIVRSDIPASLQS